MREIPKRERNYFPKMFGITAGSGGKSLKKMGGGRVISTRRVSPMHSKAKSFSTNKGITI